MSKRVEITSEGILVKGRPPEEDPDPLANLLWALADYWDPHMDKVLQEHGVHFQRDDGSLLRPGVQEKAPS